MKILIVVNHFRGHSSGAALAMEHLGKTIRKIDPPVDFIFRDNIELPLFSISPNLSAIVHVPLSITKNNRAYMDRKALRYHPNFKR